MPSPSPSPVGLLPAAPADQQVGSTVTLQTATPLVSPARASYAFDPPSSGPYYIDGAPWGFTTDTLTPEVFLNNLARGGVVILYNCNPPSIGAPPPSCTPMEDSIQSFISSAPQEALFSEVKLVASQYPVSDHPIILLAWGYQLYMDTWDPALAQRFYAAHVDNGPLSQA